MRLPAAESAGPRTAHDFDLSKLSTARIRLTLQAVRHYDEVRRWRLRFYQLNSRALTPVFQSDSRLVGTLRDWLMGPMCYFPPTRRMMLTTLVGAQRNGVPWMTIPLEEYMGWTH